jgi:hypothetical protein
MDPRGGPDDMQNYRDSNFDPSVCQPVASPYTECTTAALRIISFSPNYVVGTEEYLDTS